MAKISSGVNFTSDYFLGNFYTYNRDASKKTNRGNFKNAELSFEDSRALTRATKRLKRNDYSTNINSDDDSDDISESIKSSIEAFATTYNNMIDSGKSSDDDDMKRYMRQLKTLTKNYSDDLDDIGITIESDGKLTVNSELLSMADNDSVSKLFSADSEYLKKSARLAARLNNAAYNDICTQISTKNLHINITI